MLGKLIKYEYKATGRSFWPLYMGIIIMALLQNIFGIYELDSPQGLTSTQQIMTLIFGALIIAVVVVTLAVVIRRFKNNLLSDEGYLMFTIPVSIRALLFSKIIVAVTWMITSILVIVSATFIIFAPTNFIEVIIEAAKEIMQQISNVFGTDDWLTSVVFIIITLITRIVQCMGTVLVIYLAIVMGELMIFRKWRVPVGIIIFIVINSILSQFLGWMFIANARTVGVSTMPLIECFVSVLIYSGVFELIRYMLKNHLNLE